MNSRILGSILMMLGTSIGAGMLALPIASAHENILLSTVVMLLAWTTMTFGALAFLEVNLWMEPGSNLVTMSKKVLGEFGRGVTWIIYLFLLYSLLAAYLAGAGDILHGLLGMAHINIPHWASTLFALLLLGAIVYRGIGSIDIVNRGLMSVKLLAYAILVIAIAPHIQLDFLKIGDFQYRIESQMVMITSFGFAIIVPSLRDYLNSDQRILTKVVLYSSLLPLIIYLIWILVIQGALPRFTPQGLIAMNKSADTNTLLMLEISRVVNSVWMGDIAKLFISICTLTSFLGVSLCMTDFIADGIKKSKSGKSGALVYAITYLPPVILVLFIPSVFIQALAFAGILCVLLLILLPIALLYVGRYHKQFQTLSIAPGGRLGIGLISLLGICVMILALYQL